MHLLRCTQMLSTEFGFMAPTPRETPQGRAEPALRAAGCVRGRGFRRSAVRLRPQAAAPGSSVRGTLRRGRCRGRPLPSPGCVRSA